MEIRPVAVGEADAERRKAYFDVQALDGSPATGEAGGQPEVSVSGAGFTPTGISALSAIGFGQYFAIVGTEILTNEGDVILTRYKSGATKEAKGDAFQVVDPSTGYADPTSGAISNLSYATAVEGDLFFSTRLNSSAWVDATYADRWSSLVEASRRISRLNFAGEIANQGQILQFPRKNTFQASISSTIVTTDLSIPADIKIAAFLIAIKLLEGFDMDVEIENLTKVGARYHQIHANYDRSRVPDYLVAGIPSAEAWSYLRPYLSDPTAVAMTRVN